jgi:DNA-binding transcriptional LysR family regulator
LIEVSTPAGLADMVKAGLGVSILPALAASTSAFSTLTFMPLQSPELQRKIYIITRKGRALSPAAETMMIMLQDYFKTTQLPHHVTKAPS